MATSEGGHGLRGDGFLAIWEGGSLGDFKAGLFLITRGVDGCEFGGETFTGTAMAGLRGGDLGGFLGVTRFSERRVTLPAGLRTGLPPISVDMAMASVGRGLVRSLGSRLLGKTT